MRSEDPGEQGLRREQRDLGVAFCFSAQSVGERKDEPEPERR